MSITIGNHSFDGPFTSASQLLARSGVYAILGRGATGGNWIVVDIGESGDVRSRVENHDRKPQWQGCGHATLSVAALYCDAATRMVVEQTLRLQYNPACGDR
jgi:hypothetical protein